MTGSDLLSFAGVITKDPTNTDYPVDVVYSMLSAGQEAAVRLLHYTYLKELKVKVSRSGIAAPGTFNIGSNFLRPSYFERDSDNVEIEFIDVERKGGLRNSLNGGTDNQPTWIMYDNNGTLTGQIIVDTYPITATQFYIKKPPEISDTQNPVLIGFDSLIIAYFKHLFHLSEGQVELSSLAFQTFKSMIDDYNSKLR